MCGGGGVDQISVLLVSLARKERGGKDVEDKGEGKRNIEKKETQVDSLPL